METKIEVTYSNGTLIPLTPLDLKEGSRFEVVLQKDDLYSAFSLASEDSDVEEFRSAQQKVVNHD